jgi:hypothetical protein
MEPNFSRAANGTVIYWDDMSLTSPRQLSRQPW